MINQAAINPSNAAFVEGLNKAITDVTALGSAEFSKPELRQARFSVDMQVNGRDVRNTFVIASNTTSLGTQLMWGCEHEPADVNILGSVFLGHVDDIVYYGEIITRENYQYDDYCILITSSHLDNAVVMHDMFCSSFKPVDAASSDTLHIMAFRMMIYKFAVDAFTLDNQQVAKQSSETQ